MRRAHFLSAPSIFVEEAVVFMGFFLRFLPTHVGGEEVEALSFVSEIGRPNGAIAAIDGVALVVLPEAEFPKEVARMVKKGKKLCK